MLYQLNLGTCYSEVHPILYVSLLKTFYADGDGHPHPKAVHVEDEQEWEAGGILWYKGSGGKKRSIGLHIQDMTNLKLVGYYQVSL